MHVLERILAAKELFEQCIWIFDRKRLMENAAGKHVRIVAAATVRSESASPARTSSLRVIREVSERIPVQICSFGGCFERVLPIPSPRR